MVRQGMLVYIRRILSTSLLHVFIVVLLGSNLHFTVGENLP